MCGQQEGLPRLRRCLVVALQLQRDSSQTGRQHLVIVSVNLHVNSLKHLQDKAVQLVVIRMMRTNFLISFKCECDIRKIKEGEMRGG